MKGDVIYRQAAIDECNKRGAEHIGYAIAHLPSVQPEYEPVTAEDFAKTMSENTLYQYMVWYGVYLTLMKEQGFEICKKK